MQTLAFLLAGTSLLACSNGHSETDAPAAGEQAVAEYIVNVKTEEIVPAKLTDMLVLPGETEAMDDVRLAAERSGIIEWAGVEEGQKVKKGDHIIRIDLSALKAALDRAKANYSLAEQQLKRRKKLYAKKVLSREEMDEAETEVLVADANVREAEVNYRYGVVTSPVAGVVNKRVVDPGEYVGAGDHVADIVNVTQLKVVFNVPEIDVRYLKEGQKAPVSIDAFPGRKWDGIIDFVAWKADEATRTFPVRLIIDNKDGAVRPGMIARATFVRRALTEAVTVPLFAVLDKGGERIVFVEKNDVAQARTVTLGVIDGERVQVLKGLSIGDKLIIAGHREVEDGTKVNVR